jgi:hypothetical protein
VLCSFFAPLFSLLTSEDVVRLAVCLTPIACGPLLLLLLLPRLFLVLLVGATFIAGLLQQRPFGLQLLVLPPSNGATACLPSFGGAVAKACLHAVAAGLCCGLVVDAAGGPLLDLVALVLANLIKGHLREEKREKVDEDFSFQRSKYY